MRSVSRHRPAGRAVTARAALLAAAASLVGCSPIAAPIQTSAPTPAVDARGCGDLLARFSPVGFVDGAGRRFTPTMASVETTVARRDAWAEIPMFRIAVEMLTEEI